MENGARGDRLNGGCGATVVSVRLVRGSLFHIARGSEKGAHNARESSRAYRRPTGLGNVHGWVVREGCSRCDVCLFKEVEHPVCSTGSGRVSEPGVDVRELEAQENAE